jgi:hypothetical protein
MSAEPGPTSRGSRPWLLLTTIGVLCIAGWAVPALLMAGRGFSVQDEGTYVLSYRWWDTNPYFISGSQYLYGPVFELVHERIWVLRVLRLVMVVAANGWFGWTFCRWLAEQRGTVLSKDARLGGTVLLTAAGGLAYLWTPLTPGYYDLEADASLALVALLLCLLVRLESPPLWVPALAGVLSLVLVLTKWPALLVVLVTQAAALLVLARSSRRQAWRYASALTAGVVLAALACQVLLFPLARVFRIIRRVSALTATENHSLSFLMHTYLHSVELFVVGAVIFAIPAVATYLVAVRLPSEAAQRYARPLVLAGVLVSGLLIPLVSGWHGGDDKGRVVVAVVLALLVAALVAATVPVSRGPESAPPSRRSTDRLVIVVLLLVPVGQALGTNVPLVYVAGECLAMWVAGVVVLASRPGRAPLSSYTVAASLTMLVVAVAAIAGTTTMVSPFKTTGYWSDTASVAALGVRVSPRVAEQDAALQRSLAPYVTRGVTPMFTLDERAGLTYLLGGVPMGSTWTDSGTPDRTAGILELACRNGDVDESPPPILLFNRTPDPAVIHALGVCGFAFPGDFRALPVTGGPPGIKVYVSASPAS